MSALAVATRSEDSAVADLDLVARVRAGDDRAFELLFLRYQPRIAAYVNGMVRDHARAEDITQEVFLAALRRIRTSGETEREIQFRPWIYEIAKNRCIDAYRRGRNTVEVSFDAHEGIGDDEHRRLAGPGSTPDDAIEGKLAFDNLRSAFGGLSEVHHDVLVMREFEGLSYREIGDRLGMSRAGVESTLFRARKRLTEEYEQLVSGERCRLVQRIVDGSPRGLARAGLRDQRRIARHLAHCQPCRRHAAVAGVDLGELARLGGARAAAARVAAFLPLPAFLRRRPSVDETSAQLFGSQSARPVAQWSAHVAGTLDPALVTGWTKAFATAATVAVAGVGAGSAIGERAGVPAPSAFGAPVVRVADDVAQRAQSRALSGPLSSAGNPAPVPLSAAAGGERSALPDARAGATTSSGAPQTPGKAGSGLPAAPAAGRAAAPAAAATGGPVRQLLDLVGSDGERRTSGTGGGGGGRGRDAGATDEGASSPPRPLLRRGTLTGVLSSVPRRSDRPADSTSGSSSPSASEPSSGHAPLASRLRSPDAPPAASQDSPSSSTDGDSVRPTVSDTITSTTSALTGLGG